MLKISLSLSLGIVVLAFLLSSCSEPNVPPPTPKEPHQILVIATEEISITINVVGCTWGNDDNLFCYSREIYVWDPLFPRWIEQYDAGSIVYSGKAKSWSVK